MQSIAVLLALLGSAESVGLPFTSCPNTTVVHSTATGWEDGCLGLTKQADQTTEAACKAQCYADMHCSVWQWVKAKNGDLQCWSGHTVHGCKSRAGNEAEFMDNNLIGGERIQHGAIKVLSTNNKVETLGLKKYVEKTGTEAEKIGRCKLACETDVTCTVWEFGHGADSLDGCWLESLPDNKKGERKTDSQFAKDMIAGQDIEHYCPVPTPAAPKEEFPWPWVITGIILGVLALIAIIYSLQKKPKVKKTRAVKITPEEKPKKKKTPVSESESEEEALETVYFMTAQQPTVMAAQAAPQISMPIAAPQTAVQMSMPIAAPQIALQPQTSMVQMQMQPTYEVTTPLIGTSQPTYAAQPMSQPLMGTSQPLMGTSFIR